MEVTDQNAYEQAKTEYYTLLAKRDWSNDSKQLEEYTRLISTAQMKVWQTSALEAKSAVEVRQDIRKIKEKVRDEQLNDQVWGDDKEVKERKQVS